MITGATSGIGLSAAKVMAEMGHHVIGVGRSIQRNQSAVEEILQAFPEAKVSYLLADLASQTQVRNLAEETRSLLDAFGADHLDVLVNNAGVYLENKHLTVDGIETTFAVNHLAPFLLTHQLMPLLKASKDPRVLTVSSYSHKTTWLSLKRIANPWPYVGLLAYKRSKLCNVLFTYELNRRFAGLSAYAVDPGLVNTGIASKGSDGISDWIWRLRRKQGTQAEVPAQTIAYLALGVGIDTSQGYYFRDSAPKSPSRNARRPDLAEKLWRLSTRLTAD
jgi:NAD(P)-dependent dehydrogenase (short-subunit alcohol dehydrogenase family)